MNNFSLIQIFHSQNAVVVFGLINSKYNLSLEQAGWLGGYDASLFYGDKKVEDLPKELPVVLKVDNAVSADLVKDYVMARLLVANDLFNSWPKKYLLSLGVPEKEIDEKIDQQANELKNELKEEYEVFKEEAGEEAETTQSYQPLDVKDARLAVLTAVKNHLIELCSPTIDFDALILFHNALFDYILVPGQDDIKNIAEIVKALDENKTIIGNDNLPVAGENVMPTVANWLALFRSKIGAGNWTDTLAIPKFLAGHEAGLLKPDEKIFLGRVLEFYRRLKGYPETMASLQEPDLGFIPAISESGSSNLPAGRPGLESRKPLPNLPLENGKGQSTLVLPLSKGEEKGGGSALSNGTTLQATSYKLPAQSFAKQNLGGLQANSMSDIKSKQIQNSEFRIQNSQTNLLNEDEEAELSSHKLGTANPYNLKPKTSEADLEKLVNEASAKNGVKFRDGSMQKRFTTAAVMFLKGIRDEMEICEIILKDENLGGLGAPSAIVEPVIKMLKELKLNLQPTTYNPQPSSEAVVPRNFDPKNPLKQMLDAEATAAATILPRPEVVKPLPSLPLENGKGKLTSALPLSKGEEKGGGSALPNGTPLPPTTYNLPPRMSDVTKPHPLMGGVEEMQYLSLADFRLLGATTEQRVARLNEKFALIKKESLAKFVSAIKAYRASPLFQQYVTLGANSLGQSKTITQEIAGDTGAGNFLTMEEFDALADFHGSLAY